MKQKQLFFLLLFFLLKSMYAKADDVTVGSLIYSLDGSNATVSGYVEESLPQNLVVPQEIEYDSKKYSVVAIGDRAFIDCATLTSVKLPSTVTTIKGESYIDQGGCFSGCANLESVELPGVVDIKDYAFRACGKLKAIDLGQNLKTIGPGVFQDCSSLTYLVFPSTLTDINLTDGTFDGCNIQSLIYLGSSEPATGITGATIYHPADFVTFDKNEFQYSGKNPSPAVTNLLPAGFTPQSSDFSSLNKVVGSYTASIPFVFANSDMSFSVEIPYAYTITAVQLKATVTNASRAYGDADPQFTSTYTGFVNNEDASVLTSQGTYTTTATITSDAGTYPIQQSGATAQNYVINEYEDGTLTVTKALLTMTANDKTIVSGDEVPALDIKYEGLKNNETQPVWVTEPTISTTATSTSKAGSYPITISNADAKNYQLTVNNGNVIIERAPLTITVSDNSRTYGEANPEFIVIYTGLKNGETVPEWEKQPTIETTAEPTSPAGTYPISVKDAVAVNYNVTVVEGTLTVNKAELQVKPNDASRKYGEENPAFELSYVGLKNGEQEPEWTTGPDITTTATKASPAGEYVIHIASGEARNYTLVSDVGTLTVTKAPLTVGVTDKSKKYGEDNPTFELYYVGLQNDETEPEWTVLPAITTEAEKMSEAGEYAVVVTGGELKNYEVTETIPGVLTITSTLLTIKVQNATRPYFEENPEFTYTCTGFVDNDDESVLTVKPTIKTVATKNSPAGVYIIEISGAESDKYFLSCENGELTVTNRNLTVSTKNYTRAYGEENPTFELTYDGFVNNEGESALTTKPKATTEATKTSDVGDYPITIQEGSADNYDFTYNGGTLTIEKAYQTLTWDQEFTEVNQYDQIELTATASSGLKVTYTIEGDDNHICYITQIGDKQYLDCADGGEVVLIAVQEGDKNYWQSPKIHKTIVIEPEHKVTDFEQDGIMYKVLDDNTVELVGLSEQKSKLTVPEVVSFKGIAYRVITIAKGAFQNNSTLETVVLPNSITSIGKRAFGVCTKLKSITIPNSVIVIGDAAFYGCTSLKSFSIPNSIKIINDNLFWGCTNLADVTIPEGVNYIGQEAFRECLALTSITIPSTVQEIARYAFQNCYEVTEVTCNATKVPKTHDDAFDGTMTEFATLRVPASALESYWSEWPWAGFQFIVAIGSSTESGVFTVNGITYKSLPAKEAEVIGASPKATSLDIPEFVTAGGTTYTVTSIGKGAFQNNSSIESVEMPYSITSIGKRAFGVCTSLTSVFIPNSVTEIDDAAFYGCTSLESVVIPNSIRKLSNNIFWGCSNLTDVTIPEGVTTIGEEAFRECSALASIVLPSSLTEVQKYAFQKCDALTDVYCYAENVPKTDDNAFADTPKESATLHVPAISVEDYWAAWPWGDFMQVVSLDPDAIMGVELSEDQNVQYYDLSGRRVSHPQKGHLYISNGKKVVIKK